MYQVILNEVHYGLFLDDDKNIERKLATVILRNLADSRFSCEVSFLGGTISAISPYMRNVFAGRIENHSETVMIKVIKRVLQALFPEQIPAFNYKKVRTISDMVIDETGYHLIRDYTEFGKGSWIILPLNKQIKLNIDATDEAIYEHIKSLTDDTLKGSS